MPATIRRSTGTPVTANIWTIWRTGTKRISPLTFSEIVKLIGSDVLPDDQKLVLEIAKVVRVGILQQNAYHRDDTYVPLPKQLKMMQVVLYFYRKCQEVVARGVPISEIVDTGLFEKITKIKYDIPNDQLALFDDYYKEIDDKLGKLDRAF